MIYATLRLKNSTSVGYFCSFISISQYKAKNCRMSDKLTAETSTGNSKKICLRTINQSRQKITYQNYWEVIQWFRSTHWIPRTKTTCFLCTMQLLYFVYFTWRNQLPFKFQLIKHVHVCSRQPCFSTRLRKENIENIVYHCINV